MASRREYGGLDWLRPGERELTVVGNYIVDEAPKLHPGLGGSSRLDIEQAAFVLDPQPHQRLEQALRTYITESLRIQVTTFDDSLCDKIGAMEKAYNKSKEGLWYRLWYGMGNAKEASDAWLALVPDSYGLAVAKAGVAVVFKLAENSKDNREKVFKTFSTLRDVLVSLRPDRARFRADADVSDSAASLYGAVVNAIEDMVEIILVLEKSAATKLAARFKRKNKTGDAPPTMDAVLAVLETHIKKYKDAIDLARDRTAERTEAYGHYNAVASMRVSQGIGYLVEKADDNAAVWKEQGQAQLNSLRRGELKLQQIAEEQRATRNHLMRLIMEAQKRSALEAELAVLRQHVSLNTKLKAVVSLAELCDILARPLSTYDDPANNPPNLERVFQHPSVDLSHALAEQGRLSVASQGQVQSLLVHDQFLHWLSHPHPSLILVDANVRESCLDRLSAISVLSGTLATSLMQSSPDDDTAVIHFFCGLHASPSDALYGPTGLVRSLILQLLMKLDGADPDMSRWNLDFINDRAFLQGLEQHSLPDLCSALHELLFQFRPGTLIYCIIDSISCFDIGRLLRDLGTVMERLRVIVNDTSLVPVFKVLVTNPASSTRTILNMTLFRENPGRIISLSRQDRVPGRLSARVVDDHLLKAPSPRRSRTPSPFRRPMEPSPPDDRLLRAPSPSPFLRSMEPLNVPVLITDEFSKSSRDGSDNAYWDSSDVQRRWSHY